MYSKIIKVLENEKSCIQRQINGECNNKRDCGNCDLRMEDNEIISAYDRAIEIVKLANKADEAHTEKSCDKYEICKSNNLDCRGAFDTLDVCRLCECLDEDVRKVFNEIKKTTYG